MTLLRLCVLLAVQGMAAIVVGCALVWSAGVACIVGGVLAIVAALALYDRDAARLPR